MIQIQQEYSVSKQRLWEAITNTQRMKDWYFDIKSFDLEKGEEFTFYEPGGENKYLHLCKIVQVIPQQLFQHTWQHPNNSKGISMVTWEISGDENNSRLNFSHEGIENMRDAGEDFKEENYQAGWNELIKQSLKNYLEQ